MTAATSSRHFDVKNSKRFAALVVPGRRYICGQAGSLIGTWIQKVTQSWLVFQTHGFSHDGRRARRNADAADPTAGPVGRRRRRPGRQAQVMIARRGHHAGAASAYCAASGG